MAETLISPVLIGRQHEMAVLDRALRTVREGSGQCLLVVGEAGIGKSRLAAELSQHASAADIFTLQGFCSEQDTTFPYAPWIGALRSFLASLETGETNKYLGTYGPELVKLLPELSLLMPSLKPTLPLDPPVEKHRLFETLARFMTTLAADHPLLIILEDLHWSDELSLELLHFFTRRLSLVPILILGTYRSEGDPSRLAYHLSELNRERLVEEIRLAPLARPDVSRLAQTILQTEKPPSSEWLDLLMPLTEGNPFFVEEITKSLIQTGARPGEWDPSHLPNSIQQTVQRRVETLDEPTKHVLSLASVIGERFDFDLLQGITGENELSLVEILRHLVTAQLIIEESADQFAFRHALTRQVIYGSLLLRERKALHQRIAVMLESLLSAHAEAAAAPLAYHFYHAGDWQKAMEYSQRAGEKAQALYAPREALTHYTHALEAAGQLGIPNPLASLNGRAQMLSMLGDFDGARVDFETIIELTQRDGDHTGEWQALMDLGYAWQPRDLARAGEYFQQALQLARTMDDALVLGQSLNRLGNWYFFRGRPGEALELHGEAFDIFQQCGNRRGMATTLELLGMASYGIGDVIRGTEYYEQAVPLLREVDDRQSLVRALEFMSMRARLDTEVLGGLVFSQLPNYSEQAYEIAHSFDWREGEGEALSRAGICWSRMGEYERGLELLQRAQQIGEEINHRHLLTSIHLITGDLYLSMIALDQARQHLELAFSLAQEVGAIQLLKSLQPQLVRTCLQQGDLSRAKAVLAVLSITDDLAEIERAGIFERACWSAQAELELALGHSPRVLEIVDRLIGCAHNLAEFGPHAIPWLSITRAQALTDLNRYEAAVGELAGAQKITRARGEFPLLWRSHAILGKVYRRSGRRLDAEQEFSAARKIIQDLANHVPEGDLRENFLYRALAMIPAEHGLTPHQAAKKEFGGLTNRERELAVLIAHGKSNREIAHELVISEKTAERHVANIMAKLGFTARTQIAAWVVTKGIDK